MAGLLDLSKNGAAAVKPSTPPPVQQRVDTAPETRVDDSSDPDAAARAAQPTPPSPKEPPGFESRVPEREPQFRNADIDTPSDADLDAEFGEHHKSFDDEPEPDKEPEPKEESTDPFSPELLSVVLPNDKDEPTPDWTGQTSDTPSYAHHVEPEPTQDYPINEEPDEGSSKFGFASGGALSGLLEKPKEFIRNNPRPVMVGAIGLVALLVMAVVLPGGDPSATTPSATPGTVAIDETPVGEDEAAEEPVILRPAFVRTRCSNPKPNAAAVLSDDKSGAWVCNRDGGMDGQYLKFEFSKDERNPKTVRITKVEVMPGWNWVEAAGHNHWNDHMVVSKILWAGDGQDERAQQNFKPIQGVPAEYTFPNGGMTTTTLELVVQQTIRPEAADAAEVPEGGVLPPLIVVDGGGPGSDSDVEKTVAIGQVVIWGYVLN